ncbi:hypothetical protein HIM_11496 [Hirsutella minnesotensis 3608]|uniref:Low temperature requirement A n=1 Tax=Hirsutella minnesotensis 3608 TaxID=1043627 RepID=A0A0F7ZWK2_9HYPO|nr:hypothetical protein HIM_11496 [Hirsutella minnesotensis 3608]
MTRSSVEPVNKLRLFKSPLTHDCGGDDSDNESPERMITDTDSVIERSLVNNIPRFARREEPSLLELFYDLLFAANYNVFSNNQEPTDDASFQAYIGFFFLLWITWLLVTLFDVRYVTDSILSRVTRAVQLGVLVGFTIVAPNFNPSNLHAGTMQAMSLILAASRAILAIEYGVTLWYTKAYKKAYMPLLIQIAIHAFSTLIYFSISFAFTEGKRNRIYLAWYIVAGFEAILTVVISNFSPVLSFTSTHLIKRLTLLTVIIIGDGIIQIAREVVVIVKNPDAWDQVTIGLVAAAVGTVYFIFLIYFDWLRSSFYLPAIRQQIWMAVHLPFHLSLILFSEGFTQFLIWSKIIDVLKVVSSGLQRADINLGHATSAQVQSHLNQTARDFFSEFPPKIITTLDTVNDALNNVTQIPDSFWPLLAQYYTTNDAAALQGTEAEDTEVFSKILEAIMSSMTNALFATFGFDLESEVKIKNPRLDQDVQSGGFQGQVQEETWDRYKLVFATTYVAGGCSLIFMVILAITARTGPLRLWPIIRIAIVVALALSTGLTALLFFNPEKAFNFLWSNWVLPAITLIWTIVLVITHINGDNVARHLPSLDRRLKSGGRDSVSSTWTIESISKPI